MNSIHTDETHRDDEDTYDSLQDGADAFLRRWNEKSDAETPSDDNDEEERPDESDAEDDDAEGLSEDEADEEDDNDPKADDGDEDEPATKYAEDDFKTKVKVGDTEHEVSVKDLKRLYGQEQALTQKSQEVAALRKQHEDIQLRNVAASEVLMKRAQERYAPYAKVDWNLLATQVPEDQYLALREEAVKAYQDLTFYSESLDGHIKQAQEYRTQTRMNEAKAAVAEALKPETGIPGFNEQVFNDMVGYMGKMGVNENQFLDIMSPVALKVIHKAMAYDKIQKAKANTKPISKAPKKLVKSSVNSETARALNNPRHDRQAMDRLKRSGRVDDAANAFLSRWSKD